MGSVMFDVAYCVPHGRYDNSGRRVGMGSLHGRVASRHVARRGGLPATQTAVYGVLASIFKDAVRDRIVAFSPCDRIELRKVEPRKAHPLTASQVTTLAEAIGPEYKALIVTAAGTDLRIGELLGLTVDRVDFLRRVITVDRQLGDGGDFGPTKTEASNRKVPLPNMVGAALSEHIRVHGTGRDGLIFHEADGSPLNRAWFYDAWGDAVSAADSQGPGLDPLPADTRFHDYADVRVMPMFLRTCWSPGVGAGELSV